MYAVIPPILCALVTAHSPKTWKADRVEILTKCELGSVYYCTIKGLCSVSYALFWIFTSRCTSNLNFQCGAACMYKHTLCVRRKPVSGKYNANLIENVHILIVDLSNVHQGWCTSFVLCKQYVVIRICTTATCTPTVEEGKLLIINNYCYF